jgi:hypothetical protein
VSWKRIIFLLALLPVLPYARSVVYRFPAPVPFSGDQFYNPYPQWKAPWQRANLHAHGRAWNGLTSGREQSNEEVVRTYRDLGYAVAGISNYHHISGPLPGSALPIYEHGYNLRKRHQLAIGARGVEWFDFPLGQLASHEQLILDLVKRKSDLVALAHPSVRGAYSPGSLAHLAGYQLIEVVNGPFIDNKTWDAVLSSGRAVWGLANDDIHDLEDPRRMARAWNMVNAATASEADVIDALRKGYFYAVLRLEDDPTAELTALEHVEFKDGTLTITCSGRSPAFEFFGQGGVIKKTVRDRLTASYTFDATDTYIRTIIWSPRRVFYLNPILRWDGSQLPAPAATVNQPATWTLRLAFVGLVSTLIVIRRKRRERRLSKTGPGEAAADADRRSA